MGQIANDVAKVGGTYILMVQSKHDGSNREWRGNGETTYRLKVQIGYDGSDRECRGKGRNHVPPERADRIRWVRLQTGWQGEKPHTS